MSRGRYLLYTKSDMRTHSNITQVVNSTVRLLRKFCKLHTQTLGKIICHMCVHSTTAGMYFNSAFQFAINVACVHVYDCHIFVEFGNNILNYPGLIIYNATSQNNYSMF